MPKKRTAPFFEIETVCPAAGNLSGSSESPGSASILKSNLLRVAGNGQRGAVRIADEKVVAAGSDILDLKLQFLGAHRVELNRGLGFGGGGSEIATSQEHLALARAAACWSVRRRGTVPA